MFLAVLLVLLAPSAGAEEFLWTISASTTDPFVNTAEPTFGMRQLHLWLACSTMGMSAAWMDLEWTGAIQVVAATPCCGFLYSENLQCILAAAGGCPSAPARAFVLWALDGPGSIGFVPCPLVEGNYTVDCSADPQIFPNAWIGFSNDGTPPPSQGSCAPVPVQDTSWGRVKTFYR
jgi:hypothetical protein